MQFDETGRQSELTITVAKIDGKFRSWRSVRANGEVLIADGKFATAATPREPSRSAATSYYVSSRWKRPTGDQLP